MVANFKRSPGVITRVSPCSKQSAKRLLIVLSKSLHNQTSKPSIILYVGIILLKRNICQIQQPYFKMHDQSRREDSVKEIFIANSHNYDRYHRQLPSSRKATVIITSPSKPHILHSSQPNHCQQHAKCGVCDAVDGAQDSACCFG